MNENCQKLGAFIVQVQFLRANINPIFSKTILYLNIRLGEQFLLKTFEISIISQKIHLLKINPIFACSHSRHAISNQKILLRGLLKCKYLLNLTCHIIKFHNRQHANVCVSTQRKQPQKWQKEGADTHYTVKYTTPLA